MGDSGRKRRHLKKPSLSVREVRFCVLWVELGNATQCYLDAGLPAKVDRAGTAKAASELFRKPEISAFIRNLQTAATEAAKVTVSGIATGLQRSASKDLRKLYDRRGRIKPPHEWPDELAAVIEGVESEEIFETVIRVDPDTGKPVRCKELVGYVRKVKTTNRTEAQKTLAQWKRMIGSDVPPLEVLLNALPLDVARVVREAIARTIQPGGTGTGGSDRPADRESVE